MMKVYICSPYRAKDGAELDRNIEYAQALTRQPLTYLHWVQLQRAVPESLRLRNERISRRLHGGKN